MSISEKKERIYLLDSNVFISAIKHPAKNSLVLDLILECINNPEILLVGNDILILEMKKYRDKFNSLTASIIFSLFIRKTRIIEPSKESLQACRPFFPVEKIKDVVHAATAYQSNSKIITNDKHFKEIGDSKKIKVVSISEAIEEIFKND